VFSKNIFVGRDLSASSTSFTVTDVAALVYLSPSIPRPGPEYDVLFGLVLVWYLFICHGTSTRRQRRDLFGLRVKLLPVTTSLTTQ